MQRLVPKQPLLAPGVVDERKPFANSLFHHFLEEFSSDSGDGDWAPFDLYGWHVRKANGGGDNEENSARSPVLSQISILDDEAAQSAECPVERKVLPQDEKFQAQIDQLLQETLDETNQVEETSASKIHVLQNISVGKNDGKSSMASTDLSQVATVYESSPYSSLRSSVLEAKLSQFKNLEERKEAPMLRVKSSARDLFPNFSQNIASQLYSTKKPVEDILEIATSTKNAPKEAAEIKNALMDAAQAKSTAEQNKWKEGEQARVSAENLCKETKIALGNKWEEKLKKFKKNYKSQNTNIFEKPVVPSDEAFTKYRSQNLKKHISENTIASTQKHSQSYIATQIESLNDILSQETIEDIFGDYNFFGLEDSSSSQEMFEDNEAVCKEIIEDEMGGLQVMFQGLSQENCNRPNVTNIFDDSTDDLEFLQELFDSPENKGGVQDVSKKCTKDEKTLKKRLKSTDIDDSKSKHYKTEDNFKLNVETTIPSKPPARKQTKITDLIAKTVIKQNQILPAPAKPVKKFEATKVTDYFPKSKIPTKKLKEAGSEKLLAMKQSFIRVRSNGNISCTQSIESAKANKFQVPYMHNVSCIDDETAAKLLAKLQDGVKEIQFNLVYTNGLNQLSELPATGHPIGILLSFTWADADSSGLYFLNTPSIDTLDHGSPVTNLFTFVLGPSSLPPGVRRTCCGSKDLLLHVLGLVGPDNLPGNVWDPLIGCWLLNPERRFGGFADVTGALSVGSLSAAVDAMIGKLENEALLELFLQLEVKLTPILAVMESRGVRIDETLFSKLGEDLSGRIRECESQAAAVVGRKFPLNSRTELQRILYEDLHLNAGSSTAGLGGVSNEKSVSEIALLRLSSIHPLPAIVIDYRKLQKTRQAQVETIRKCLRNGAIHPKWDQTSAATGRVKATDPRCEPAEGGWGAAPFSAGAGRALLAIDLPHVELFLVAHFAQDGRLLAALRCPGNVHRNIGDAIKGGGAGSWDQRNWSGRILQILMYGEGPRRMADSLGVDFDEARCIIERFHAKFPSATKLRAEIVKKAKLTGYVRSVSGRKLNFAKNYGIKNKNYIESQMLKFYIQAAAADIVKVIIIQVRELLGYFPLVVLNNQIIWEVPINDLPMAQSTLKNAIKIPQHFNVKLNYLNYVILSGNNVLNLKNPIAE